MHDLASLRRRVEEEGIGSIDFRVAHLVERFRHLAIPARWLQPPLNPLRSPESLTALTAMRGSSGLRSLPPKGVSTRPDPARRERSLRMARASCAGSALCLSPRGCPADRVSWNSGAVPPRGRTARQQEIELGFDGLVRRADAAPIAKSFVHCVSSGWGLTATFLPKPMHGRPGDRTHLHRYLVRGGTDSSYVKGVV